ncbi:hypothetical protein [Halorubellus sp. PRR65]|uniref:hypothetical protein n=1 Tax=Halorubellus sp. PRR65 TaxID=3098148 RepID=UPI002B25F9C7|nr:hypothetical protein [Halorubellus sp. PRR65]
MNHGRIVLAMFVIAALIVGTAGYDSIQGDRSADVEVANDADAYLALEETGATIENGSTGEVLRLTNQFGTTVDLVITDVETSSGVTNEGLNRSTRDPGKTATLNVTCTSASTGIITVDIEATGDGISFQTTRTITVACQSSMTTSG